MKTLIIIGGGFAGSLIAKKLENKFKTILIDTKDYFEFTPSIVKALINPNYTKKIQRKHSYYLKNTEIIISKLKHIIGNEILLKNKQKIKFDYLIIATGTSYHTPFKQSDILIPQRILNIKEQNKKLQNAKSVLIIGAGIVGIETALKLHESYKDKEIILVNSRSTILERQPKKAQKFIKTYLEKNKINLFLNERVISYKDNSYQTDKKTIFKADFVLAATGITPNSKFIGQEYLNTKGFILVDPTLRLKENIFVLGDVNSIREEKTAQSSEKQALLTIKNIVALEKNKPLSNYKIKQRPIIISLGKNKALFIYKNFIFSGFIPGLMKKVIEYKTLKRYS